jgi:hypothetical protein
MQIPLDTLAKFHVVGLLTSRPFPVDHVAYPDGVSIAKPAAIKGNVASGYRCTWGLNGPALDAPAVVLHREGDEWIVSSMDSEPGPGAGDFVNKWVTEEEAVADIIDFFFGDPQRMSLK